MRRSDIRRAVAIVMADKGYRRAWHGWAGCELMYWTESGKGRSLGRLPSGMSRKRLDAALETIKPIGSPLPAPKHEKADRWRQVDLEDAIGEARR